LELRVARLFGIVYMSAVCLLLRLFVSVTTVVRVEDYAYAFIAIDFYAGTTFFISISITHLGIKRMCSMIRASELGNVPELETLNSVGWILAYLALSGIIPRIILLISKASMRTLE